MWKFAPLDERPGWNLPPQESTSVIDKEKAHALAVQQLGADSADLLDSYESDHGWAVWARGAPRADREMLREPYGHCVVIEKSSGQVHNVPLLDPGFLTEQLQAYLGFGRIRFRGNPWNEHGHRVNELVWTGQLRDYNLWFDLHLETDSYDEDSKPSEPDHGTDWTSPGCWTNYSACMLSSTHWPDYRGLLAATPGAPLSIESLSGHTFRIDPNPGLATSLDPAFGIYLLGHDSVADHTIRFQTRSDGCFDLTWTGRIALSYAGEDTFNHRFEALVNGIRLRHIAIPPNLPVDRAAGLLADLGIATDPNSLTCIDGLSRFERVEIATA